MTFSIILSGVIIADHLWWHIGHEGEGTVAVLVALIGLSGVIWSNRKALKQVDRKVDTGNDRAIGETVHDMAQQQEIAAVIQHTNTRELVLLSEHMVRMETKIDYWIETSKGAHDAINMRLDRIEEGERNG